MAEDISPQIHEQLISSINQNNARNRKENRIAVDAENGKVDIRSASEYAGMRGQDVADALLEISGSDLPNGRMYYNIAEKAVRPVLNDLTEQVLDVADQAIISTNTAAGLGLKAVRPDETEKVKGILDLASSRDWDDVKNEVASSTENLARKCVDDSVRENADFQYQAGLDPKIIRTASRGACDWCREVAGTYDYADVSDRGNDVFRRHADCNCLVEYEPVKGQRKTVSGNRDKLVPEERENKAHYQISKIAPSERELSASEQMLRKRRLDSTADPMFEVTGRAEDSNPEEVKMFIEELRSYNVELIRRDYEDLGYAPGLRAGMPGQVHISENASYSAWCHEMQHVRDDKNAGWAGYFVLTNRDKHYEFEKRAYDIEIKLAMNAGREDIAQRLKDNLEIERRKIYENRY